MPNILPQLRKIFKEGINSIPRRDLELIFSKNPSDTIKIFRRDSNPKRLMREGFRADLPGPLTERVEYLLQEAGYSREQIQSMARGEISLPKDVLSSVPEEMQRDTKGLYWGAGRKAVNSQVPSYNRRGELIQGLIDIEDPKYDYIWSASKDADIAVREVGEGIELVQQKPNKVLAKYKDIIRILGLMEAFNVIGKEEK